MREREREVKRTEGRFFFFIRKLRDGYIHLLRTNNIPTIKLTLNDWFKHDGRDKVLNQGRNQEI